METPIDDAAWAHVQALHAADTAVLALGISLVAASAGSAEVQMTVAEQHLGSLGQLHGGVLFTLADAAMSYASNSRGDASMAIRASVDFIDVAAVGEVLIARAVEHNLRGKSGIYDAEIRAAADDRMIATFRGNTLRLK